ncbi:MAG: hypothetical protein B7Z75_06485 [Acidocella sp. 20-57-95]|nr:MAG: hypothetical protein B7Z75_06485 [Acidocella sp. 20-57-95]HQT64789.1 hypothetical protein [Acidocella sp.]
MTDKVVYVRNPTRLYAIELADPAWRASIGYLACHPHVEGGLAENITLSIRPNGPFVALCENGKPPRNFAAIDEVREHLHGRFFLESMPVDRPLLHAACLKYKDRRVLIVGPKNAGKSTLTLALGLAGFAIEGDENVLIDLHGVTARPRACRVKESSFSVLPILAPLTENTAFITDFHGRKIYNVPPDLLGQPWRIATGKVDLIIVIHANHGGMSSIRPLPPLGLTQEIMAETAFPAAGKALGVAAIARMVSGAAGYDLSSGDLWGAVACIKAVLSAE